MKIYIGCSGWQYREWKGVFYPSNLAQTQWFEYYAAQFNTVEINNTFYRFPQQKTLEKWREQAPPEFTYCLKAPRFITHLHKFINTERQVKDFYRLLDLLKEKLACVLFQLPATLQYHPDSLMRMLAQMDPHYHNVIEFRHPSWWCDEVYQALANAGVGFCHVSSPMVLPNHFPTAKYFYLRFHGPQQWFCGLYSLAQLQEWAEKLKHSGAEAAWIYFNNTADGAAIQNAYQMQKILLNG